METEKIKFYQNCFERENSFYYDESEKTNKLNLESFNADNFVPYFFSVIIGIDEKEKERLEQNYLDYEEKYKKEGQKELKNIDFKNASQVKDFLKIIKENKVKIFVTVENKFEYLFEKILPFKNFVSKSFGFVNWDEVRSALTHIFTVYWKMEKNNFYSVFQKHKNIDEIKKGLNEILLFCEKEENAIFKKQEIEKIKKVERYLDFLTSQDEIEWEFEIPFKEMKNLVSENSIFVLDKEGTGKTMLGCAKEFESISQIDSKESVEVRICDCFCRIFKFFFIPFSKQTILEKWIFRPLELPKELYFFKEGNGKIDKKRFENFKEAAEFILSQECLISSGKYLNTLYIMLSYLELLIGGKITQDNERNRFLLNNHDLEKTFRIQGCLGLRKIKKEENFDTQKHFRKNRYLLKEGEKSFKIYDFRCFKDGEITALVKDEKGIADFRLPAETRKIIELLFRANISFGTELLGIKIIPKIKTPFISYKTKGKIFLTDETTKRIKIEKEYLENRKIEVFFDKRNGDIISKNKKVVFLFETIEEYFWLQEKKTLFYPCSRLGDIFEIKGDYLGENEKNIYFLFNEEETYFIIK